MAAPLPSVRVLWRPEQFNRVTNGTFETNTTGWLATAGINAAATSITRITTDFHSGTACASVVCTATDTSGVNFDLGSNRFYLEASYGTVYIATGWVKRVSGSKRLRVTLGSLGTSSDRATLTITDLVDAWQPFVIRWLPTANRTDVELAVTNGSAEALTFRLDDVKVYAVDAFSQVENGTFETDTTGWTAYLGGAIARDTGTSFGGSAHGRITSSATAYSGAFFGLGTRTFTSGRTYRLRFAAKTISGTTGWYAEFYDTVGATSRANTTFTATSSWEWYTLDWTAAATYTGMEVGIYHVAASAAVLAIDEVEVYEAVDDLGSDTGDIRWSRSIDGIGTINVKVKDNDGKYHPRNTAAALYGSLAPGKRIWGRATYSNALYPLFFGTLTTIEPPQLGGIHTDLNAEDVMGDLSRASCYLDFGTSDSYATVRSWVISSLVADQRAASSSLAATSHQSLASGIESNTFYHATDGDVGALDLLADLNEATQSVHLAKPTVHANIGWRYTTVDRATLTDTSSDFTVNEDFADLTGIRVTHEALENRQDVPWQAYELLPPPAADTTGYGLVVVARDPTSYSTDADAEDPYLHYTDDEYGTDDAHPEPRWKYPRGMTPKRWKRLHKRGHKYPRRTRVFLDAFVPFTLASGDRRSYTIDFSIPMSGVTVTSDNGIVAATIIESRPMRVVVEFRAVGAGTVNKVEVTATPWLPLDEMDEDRLEYESIALYGKHDGETLSTPYIPSLGDAQGVGDFRNWRYGSPRMRPTLVDHNAFPRSLTADLTDHFTVSADRWRVASLLFVSTGCTWEVTQGGLDWRSWHELEELPTHTAWFTLDSSALDGADILAY